jgi:hypothetical protein
MQQDQERRIRERAYEIWEREGCSGDPKDHWLRAERELKGAVSDGGDASGAKTTEDKIADSLGNFA